jgi:hypothetical protein
MNIALLRHARHPERWKFLGEIFLHSPGGAEKFGQASRLGVSERLGLLRLWLGAIRSPRGPSKAD